MVRAPIAIAALLIMPMSSWAHAQLPEIQAGQKFKDCQECPEMTWVQGGTFMMGANALDHEQPQHQVTIRPLAVGIYEVTFEEWDACIRAKGCGQTTASPLGLLLNRGEEAPRDPSGPYGDEGWGRGKRPAINIRWEHAEEYVRWLSSRTGKPYRLLSEAEWEYTARAGSSTAWPWGASEQDGCAYANLADRTFVRELERALRDHRGSSSQCSDGVGGRTAPVGRYKANAFGLHDMIGNVAEWVVDCWSDTYLVAPSNGSARNDSNSPICSNHVVRGGSWLEPAAIATAAFRYPMSERTDAIGFRVARSAQ